VLINPDRRSKHIVAELDSSAVSRPSALVVAVRNRHGCAAGDALFRPGKNKAKATNPGSHANAGGGSPSSQP
jgi:hypothetical protein